MTLYTDITDTILAQLDAGVRPWSRPWGAKANSFARPIRANGERYTGINVLLLQSAANKKGFDAPRWMTFKQALALGAAVRKGETSSKVVFASTFARPGDDGEAGREEPRIGFMKLYSVFNVEQIDGLAPEYLATAPTPALHQRIAAADAFVAAAGAEIRTAGPQAYYHPAQDYIAMPPLAEFCDPQSYYATLAHELIHWTGADKRLARTLGQRFGDRAYAAEELVAELGAAFLCADLAISAEPRADHASYLASWIEVLKADPRAIFTAASMASKAAEHLHQLAQAQPAAPATVAPAHLAPAHVAPAHLAMAA